MFGSREGGGGDGDDLPPLLVRVALVVVEDPLQAHDIVQVVMLPRGAGAAAEAEFAVKTTGEPYAFYTEVVKSPADDEEGEGEGSSRSPSSALLPPPSPGPDVIVGFASLPSKGKDGDEGDAAVAPVAEIQVALGVAGGLSDVTYTLWVDPTDGLVPACLGTGPLPIIALPMCSGMSVRVGHAWTGRPAAATAPVQVVALCAMLRSDVRYAVASETFALPFARTGGRPVPLPNLDHALIVAFREPASRARAIRRNAAIFEELMKVVWHPDRVARGFVEALEITNDTGSLVSNT